jgi:hypothetical protein
MIFLLASRTLDSAATAARRVLAAVAPLGHFWLGGAVFAGLVPLLAFWGLRIPGQNLATAAILFPFFLALVAKDRQRAGFAIVLVAFVVHSLTAILLSACDPVGAGAALADGPSYWEKNITWIRTGIDPEYAVSNWLPAHGRQLAGMVVFAFTSFGLIPLAQGLYELDLMNFYVGRLAVASTSVPVALAVGWHSWAILRGVAYSRIVYEATSFSLEKITRRELSTAARRRRRWIVGLSLLSLDCLLKFTLLEPVRRVLGANLLPS